eukprot:4294901-Amphidinium_carterae.1
MSTVNLQRMEIRADPDEEMASGFVVVDGPVNTKRPKELDTDSRKDEHYYNDIDKIEKDAHHVSSSGDDTRRRKIKKDDKSWRRDAPQKRTNGWDSEW